MVAINVMRSGPGIGGIQPAQADYFQVTRGGGNGDYHIIVYAPKSIQEACEMIYKAFDVADEYRNPVMICADGMLSQMMEPVAIPDPIPAMTEVAINGKLSVDLINKVGGVLLNPEEIAERTKKIMEVR